jgi:hypothetical protein
VSDDEKAADPVSPRDPSLCDAGGCIGGEHLRSCPAVLAELISTLEEYDRYDLADWVRDRWL